MAQFNPFRWIRQLARNSPWVVMALALHVVIIAALSVNYLAGGRVVPTIECPLGIGVSPPAPVVVEPPAVPERRAPEENVPAEVVDNPIPPDYTPQEASPNLAEEVGLPDSNSDGDAGGGSSIPAGNGPGNFGNRTSPYTGRGNGEMPHVGRGHDGPTQHTEQGVRLGLIWLLRHQQVDGSWNASDLPGCCVNGKSCVLASEKFPEFWQQGLTGLSLLAFLGAGFNFDSKQFVVDTVQAKKLFFGESVKSGLKWLKSHQQADGSFGPDQHVYNEAICALALSEAYGQSHNLLWREPAQRAIDWLVRAQKQNPDGTSAAWGWRYHSRADVQALKDELDSRAAAVQARKAPLDAAKEELARARAELIAGKDKAKPKAFAQALEGIEDQLKANEVALDALKPEIQEVTAGLQRVIPELYDSDLSVTTWVIMAFKSAEAAGLKVPREAYVGGKQFALAVSTDDGRAGYLSRSGVGRPVMGKGDQFEYHHGTLGALSMLCRTFVDHDIEDPFLEKAAQLLVKDLPEVSKDRLSIDYYYWYYASLALNQFDGPDSPRKGGRYWGAWNEAMKAAVLETQDGTEDACTKGGWVTGDRWSLNGGPIYATAINVLTLEVYYRYANAFK